MKYLIITLISLISTYSFAYEVHILNQNISTKIQIQNLCPEMNLDTVREITLVDSTKIGLGGSGGKILSDLFGKTTWTTLQTDISKNTQAIILNASYWNNNEAELPAEIVLNQLVLTDEDGNDELVKLPSGENVLSQLEKGHVGGNTGQGLLLCFYPEDHYSHLQIQAASRNADGSRSEIAIIGLEKTKPQFRIQPR